MESVVNSVDNLCSNFTENDFRAGVVWTDLYDLIQRYCGQKSRTHKDYIILTKYQKQVSKKVNLDYSVDGIINSMVAA